VTKEKLQEKKMAQFEVDFYLLIVLILLEIIVLGIFLALYVKKQQSAFLALVASVVIFILSNGLSLASMILYQIEDYTMPYFDFLHGILGAAGLIPIVVFLEIFENGHPFTPRSATSSLFILFVGAIKGGKELFNTGHAGPNPELGDFFAFITPIMFILVGGFYLTTIRAMKNRIRFENQKKKLRMVTTGIYLTFILPKFILGGLVSLPVLAAILFENFDVNLILSQQTIFDIVLNLLQVIGLMIMSLPIIFSQSVFFMQSRKVSKLIVINDEGIPVFSFDFEKTADMCDQTLLNEAFVAVKGVMEEGGITCQQLQTINFGELQIMTEIRNGFAALLIVDRPTHFLNRSLELFANDFRKIFPEDGDLRKVQNQRLKYTAEKMIQKNFGLAQEEFEQIKQIVSFGYDKVWDEYLEVRTESPDEMALLPDFIERLPENAKVLDAGCGAGIPVTKILSEKFDVIGVDISKKQIEMAREFLPACEFVWQDMSTLTYPDNYFDGIISLYAITHVPREEHKGIIDNFYRMLKEGGYMMICFATVDEPGSVVDDFFGVKMYWSSFDAGTNVEMLKESGFEVVWIKLIFDDVTERQHLFVLTQKVVEKEEERVEEEKKEEKQEEKKQKQQSKDLTSVSSVDQKPDQPATASASEVSIK
jgi:ubiquinone/menaquinone biosynthesis C-methylase UbiE